MDKLDKLTILLHGDQRFLDGETLMKHIARALRGREIAAGIVHTIDIDRDGSVRINGMVAYEPKRPQIAAKAIKRGA